MIYTATIYTATVTRDGHVVALLSRDSAPYGQDDANDYPGCILVSDGVEYQGPAAQGSTLAAVVRAQLDPDEAARKELLRQLRSSAMAALIANGWTAEQAQEAGRQFIRDYGVDLWVYEFGADKGFFQAVAVDQRSWLSLPLPGHEGQTIRDLFVV